MRSIAARRAGIALVTMLAASALAACGSDDKDSADGGTGGSSNDPILIGQLTPLSGQGFNYPQWVAGTQAAIRAINADGGVNGRNLEMVECDDQNNPNQATACAREMVSKHVTAVVGGASLFGNTIAPILNAGKVAWIGPFAQSEPEYNLPNMFLLDKGSLEPGVGAAMALQQDGIEKGFVAHLSVPGGDTIYKLFQQGAEGVGLDVVGDTSFPIQATDMTPTVQQAIDSGADGVAFGGLEQQQVAFFKTAQQLGAGFTLGAVDGSLTPAEYQEIGDIRTVIVGGLPPLTASESAPDQYPGVVEFQKDIAAELASGNKAADPAGVSIHTLRAWLAVKIVASTLEDNKDATAPADFMKALEGSKDIETGVIPPWTPADKGPDGYTRVSNPFTWISVIDERGQPVLKSPEPVDLFETTGFTG